MAFVSCTLLGATVVSGPGTGGLHRITLHFSFYYNLRLKERLRQQDDNISLNMQYDISSYYRFRIACWQQDDKAMMWGAKGRPRCLLDNLLSLVTIYLSLLFKSLLPSLESRLASTASSSLVR